MELRTFVTLLMVFMLLNAHNWWENKLEKNKAKCTSIYKMALANSLGIFKTFLVRFTKNLTRIENCKILVKALSKFSMIQAAETLTPTV